MPSLFGEELERIINEPELREAFERQVRDFFLRLLGIIVALFVIYITLSMIMAQHEGAFR